MKFGLLSVDNLALQLIKLVWSLYILQTVHAKCWMSPGCKWQLHTKHKCSSTAISSGTWWVWPEHETLPVQVSPHRRAPVYRGTMHCPNFVNFIFKSLNPQKPKGLKINLHCMLLSKKVRELTLCTLIRMYMALRWVSLSLPKFIWGYLYKAIIILT